MRDKPCFIPSRNAYLHSARVVGPCSWDDLSRLKGEFIWNLEIIDVERFAVHDQTDRDIGILFKKKAW